MSKFLDDDPTLSLKLSEVMGNIGIRKEIVLKRRRTYMLMETLDTITRRIQGKNITTYNLGSQSEGSTTVDLDSDIDTLFGYHYLNIILDCKEAKPRAENVLLVQDETTAPGHCYLQCEKPKVNFVCLIDKKYFHPYGKNKWLLKNTCFDEEVKFKYNRKKGPAHSFQGKVAYNDEDNVIAWHCKYWPREARRWTKDKGKGDWPTEDIRRECEATGCIIVPVSSKNSQYKDLEWRISTCLAERCLMFSLNVTQMRCYVLMKMIFKTVTEHTCSMVKLSSYVLKTVLFYCIENTKSCEWTENKLFDCLQRCLLYLETCIRKQNCSHFFIPGHNLIRGKDPTFYKGALMMLQYFTNSNGQFLLEISLDQLNKRLNEKMSMDLNSKMISPGIQQTETVSKIISGSLISHIAVQLNICHLLHLQLVHNSVQVAQNQLTKLNKIAINSSEKSLHRSVYKLIAPLMYSSLASAIASNEIERMEYISSFTSILFVIGSSSDVSSGKLKFASALYCSGDMYNARCLLEHIEQKYHKNFKNIKTVCSCSEKDEIKFEMTGFRAKCLTGNEELIKDITSFCVKFLPSEKNCIPNELRYEIYRSTANDKLYRKGTDTLWMDLAIVDSLPFMYFLQYKTYGRLKMAEKQKTALSNFATAITKELYLGHEETAYNLIGQCCEQENKPDTALDIYIESLKIRKKNNAANVLICRLISALVNKSFHS
ncbi:uncharacterized protein LOC132755910 [Ruditapes philippinarum]|uniref:uncharacterized protein LOC132755910 n=1 Tax=Ruditapes philippinarum TaxID=129788 RepID=UPI00295A9B41|nr:uncharacterized protein LOC132755910 [Ruditapes philippinarum]